MNSKTTQSWNTHYTRSSSVLSYPDEQLVRMISKYAGEKNRAIDAGCGTGRHVKLLNECGFNFVVGVDLSFNALRQSNIHLPSYYVQSSITNLSFKNGVFDTAVAWGSLHYSAKEMLPMMLSELKQALKPHGVLFATLRSNRDTCIPKGRHLGNNTWETSLPDIKGAVISLYSEEEVTSHLSMFSEFHIGLMERTLLDDLHSLLSHWYFYARV